MNSLLIKHWDGTIHCTYGTPTSFPPCADLTDWNLIKYAMIEELLFSEFLAFCLIVYYDRLREFLKGSKNSQVLDSNYLGEIIIKGEEIIFFMHARKMK